eukprot:9218766-Pyramimonas_sp.AAC.1
MLASAAVMCRHAKGRADTKPIKKPDQLVDVEAELRRGVFGERRKTTIATSKNTAKEIHKGTAPQGLQWLQTWTP